MGIFGNGRFFEVLIQRMHGSTLTENRDIAKRAHLELEKTIPSFVRRAESGHRHCLASQKFHESMSDALKRVAKEHAITKPRKETEMVRLATYDEDGPIKVAAALLYAYGNASLEEIRANLEHFNNEKIEEILDEAAKFRENRRHKSPRALEHADFTFEICADFGVYRDLQRHRMLTQERQLLSCDYGYYIPKEILKTPMEKPYREAMARAKSLYDRISKELPEEAQYAVPMAYNIRWYFKINLRALQWLVELRSAPQGHPTYRLIAQKMAHEVIIVFPEFERFLGFVDFDGYHLGRLDQEIRSEKKKSNV
jgi:thymidylate synthase ThyX